jgi:hypothetical protein
VAVHAAALISVYVLMLADQLRAPDSHIIAVNVVPDQACPASRQVTEALSARLPGVVLPAGQAARPGMVRLAVTVDATGIRIDLADPDGTPLLHRALPARAPGECAALADTIALIIERYWREVGYDAPPLQAPAAAPPPSPPPPAPPPPRPPEPTVTPAVTIEKQVAPAVEGRPSAPVPISLALAAAVAARAGDAGARDASGMLAFTVEGRFGVRLSAGVSTSAASSLNVMGQAAFRRFPLRVGAYWPVRLGVGQLEPGLGLDLDLISVSIPNDGTQLRSPSSCSGGVCRSAGADLALGWSVVSTHHVYARALARAGLSASYDFVTGVNGDPIWRTPSTYLEVAVECGLRFP